MSELKDIKSLTLKELSDEMDALGLPAYRAEQIFKWLHEKSVTSFDEMLNIPKNIRKSLSELYYISVAIIEKKQISCYDGTIKYLFRLNDGEFIESVLMDYHHGYTICISTQVGCKMGCTFCATGKSGFSRNLAPSEMLAQIQTAQQDNHIRISNIVLMGMGEPLDNFDNVIKFLSLVSSDKGINIGMRHITISTCGVVPKIYELAKLKLQVTLSVSLHAPNDEIRSRTMPINKKYNVEKLITACRDYAKATNRRITFEYAMIDGVNDSDECAEELAQLIKGMLCHVNLIPVNNVTGTGYQKSKRKRLIDFSRILESNGITATVRRTLGSDIDASCGQLRRKHTDE
ncbi:MAG: 23S rRNA (adenine(2503)-C(2))-methyltransferase RlmN [Acutalibacteraceae bacterium]|nr:23S rRNA (adenine(2503)-C(2))-methyltransferase RlmN [Acutalibacteraceae bacterium]